MLGKRKARRMTEGLFGIGLDPILGLLLAFFTFALVLMLLIRVGEVPPLQIHTEALPDAVQWKPYTTGFAASGGVGPYRFAIEDGELPPGVFLDAEKGLLLGVPGKDSLIDEESSQTWNFTLAVSGAAGQEQRKNYSLTVCPVAVPFDPERTPLMIIRAETQLPYAILGRKYEVLIGAKGGIEPYRCEIEGLPSGLSADSDGRIFGVPEKTGDHTLTVRLRDRQSHRDLPPDSTSAVEVARQYELSVFDTGTLSAYPLLPQFARQETRFVGRIAPVGGQGPYRYRIAGGKLPAGLQLDPDSGFITGEPEMASGEPSEANVWVSDVHGDEAVVSLRIRVLPAEPNFGISLPNRWADARQNEPYAVALGNIGGVQPVRWLVEGLPEGLRLEDGNRIVGKPVAAPATYRISVTAEDATGQTVSGEYTLRVRPELHPLRIND